MRNALHSLKFNKVFKFNKLIKATRTFSLLLFISLYGLLLTGCQGQQETDSNVDTVSNNETETNLETDKEKDEVAVEFSYSFTDSLGNTVNLESKPERVVSLVGSYAETWI